MRFFDASALVKRYVQEPHTPRVRRLIAAGNVIVSRLSEVEVAAALARLVREKALTAAEGARALEAFRRDFDRWHVIELAPEVTARAQGLLERHAISANDAIQLASAQYFELMMDEPLAEFVAFDRRLLDAARAEGLAVG
jgi:predicted nucleic acid-binding protein